VFAESNIAFDIVFERGKDLLQKGLLIFTFRLGQLSEIALEVKIEKPTFQKRAL